MWDVLVLQQKNDKAAGVWPSKVRLSGSVGQHADVDLIRFDDFTVFGCISCKETAGTQDELAAKNCRRRTAGWS